MNYTECLAYLAELGNEVRGMKFGLEAIESILASLGHPERACPSAIVAGTNGKGSTSAILASILEQAVPGEASVAQRQRRPVTRKTLEHVLQVREEIMQDTNRRLFDDSTEIIRQMREERSRELEQL